RASLPAVTFVKQTLECIASVSRNTCLINFMRNLNDSTHYVLFLDLESASRSAEVVNQTEDVIGHIRAGCRREALESLRVLLRQHMAVMPELVREGLARSYSVASTDEHAQSFDLA